MTETDKLVLKIMRLAYLIHSAGIYCVFIDFSGHVDSLSIRFVASKDNYRDEMLRTEFYIGPRLSRYHDPVRFLSDKIAVLEAILEKHAIPVDLCEVEAVEIEEYTF